MIKLDKVKLEKELEEMKILNRKNSLFQHLVKHQKYYLISLIVILFLILLFTNIALERPLFLGEESYFHLAESKTITFENYHYFPLSLISGIKEIYLVFIPLIIALISFLLFQNISKKIKISPELTFTFLLFVILSPFFIINLVSLSSYSLFIFLILGGFFLQWRKKYRYASLIPFILITFIDGFSAVLLLIIFMTEIFYLKKDKTKFDKIKVFLTSLFFLANLIFFKVPFMQGPFRIQNLIGDLISDLGSLGGVSFFLIFLGIIGLFLTWKNRKFHIYYILFPVILVAYFFNTNLSFLLSLMFSFLAAIAFINIFDKEWTFVQVKKITLFLFLLGLVFTTLTFMNRVPYFSPDSADLETLTWIKYNTPNDAIIFSIPENGYYIEQIAQREAFYSINQKDELKKQAVREVINAPALREILPIFEDNKISYIYLNSIAKATFPQNRGLLKFLFDERFKLVHSSKDVEIWEFKKE